jgi:hypothetical protein
MRKVMLVIDEIQQLVGLETFLRRLGFDVLSLSKDSTVTDSLLGFQPEIAIVSRQGRNVDGVKVAQKLKRSMTPPPRIALCYSGLQPNLSTEEQKSIDALMEIPAAGESAIRLLAQLSGLKVEPLLEKYRKFATAKLTKDEQIVIIAGAITQPTSSAAVTEWDPLKNPGGSAENRTERSNRYDAFLNDHADDFANGEGDRVMSRSLAAEKMAKLKEDSKADKDFLDEIQAQKIKFAEALFDEEKKKK